VAPRQAVEIGPPKQLDAVVASLSPIPEITPSSPFAVRDRIWPITERQAAGHRAHSASRWTNSAPSSYQRHHVLDGEHGADFVGGEDQDAFALAVSTPEVIASATAGPMVLSSGRTCGRWCAPPRPRRCWCLLGIEMTTIRAAWSAPSADAQHDARIHGLVAHRQQDRQDKRCHSCKEIGPISD